MHRQRRRRHARSSYPALAATLCAFCLVYWALAPYRHASNLAKGIAGAARPVAAGVRPAAMRSPGRTHYRYSVIGGGVYSAVELNAALDADPVAAAHYAGFDRSQVRLTQAPAATPVYVSYRRGPAVYWTRRKVTLPAGEPLLTDGAHTARARCGNLISLTPRQPVEHAALDPELDLPEPPLPNEAVPTASGTTGQLLVNEIFPPLLVKDLPQGAASDTGVGNLAMIVGGGIPFRGGTPILLATGIPVAPSFPLLSSLGLNLVPTLPGSPGQVWITYVPPTGYVFGGVPAGSGSGLPVLVPPPAPPTGIPVTVEPGTVPPGSSGATPSGGTETHQVVPPPQYPNAPPRETGGGGGDHPTPYIPPPGPLPPPGDSPPYNVEIPEPSTLLLLCSALAVMARMKLSGPRP